MPYTIKNEDDFIQMLRDFISSQQNDQPLTFPDIQFEGYPTIDFNVKGEHYHSSINSYLNNAISEIIISVQKSYCLIRHNTTNLQRFTSEDKDVSDIIFKIKEGSSEGESDTSGLANIISQFLLNGMNGLHPWQKMTVLLGVLVVLGGLGLKFLDNQAQETVTIAKISEKAIDAQNATTEQLIQYIQEKGRTKLSQEVEIQAKLGQDGFLKNVAQDNRAESAKLNHTQLNRTQLDEYRKRTTIQRNKQNKTHKFLIKGIDFYNPTHLETDVTISVIRLEDDAEFSLKTSLNLMGDNEILRLKQALGTDDEVLINYEEIQENKKIVQSQFVRIEEKSK